MERPADDLLRALLERRRVIRQALEWLEFESETKRRTLLLELGEAELQITARLREIKALGRAEPEGR